MECDGPKESNDLVVLAGAGASQYLGLPGLDSLPKLSALSTRDDDVAQIIRETYDAVQARHANRTHFETVIGTLKEFLRITETMRTDFVLQRVLGPIPHDVSTGVCTHRWRQALTLCYRVLLQEYGPRKLTNNEAFTHQKATKACSTLFRRLAEINGGQLTVYTTNYDCSYQVLATVDQTLSFATHINNEDGTFQSDWYPSRPECIEQADSYVFLNRLHGCVAWFYDERSPFRVGEVYGAGRHLEIEDDDKINNMAIKLVTTPEVGNQPAFRLAFDEFEKHLHSAAALLVWGYRFQDKEVVTKLVEAANRRADSMPCFYINPYLSTEQVVQNVRDTLQSVLVQPDPRFLPKQVDWRPSDGPEALIENTCKCFRECKGVGR